MEPNVPTGFRDLSSLGYQSYHILDGSHIPSSREVGGAPGSASDQDDAQTLQGRSITVRDPGGVPCLFAAISLFCGVISGVYALVDFLVTKDIPIALKIIPVGYLSGAIVCYATSRCMEYCDTERTA